MAGILSSLHDALFGGKPVSYTHLDVYKRQHLWRSIAVGRGGTLAADAADAAGKLMIRDPFPLSGTGRSADHHLFFGVGHHGPRLLLGNGEGDGQWPQPANEQQQHEQKLAAITQVRGNPGR